MPFTTKGVRSITGRVTTGAAAEQTLNLVVDGAPAAASIAVPAQMRLSITDISLGSNENRADFKVQQSDNGAAFFDIANLNIRGTGPDNTSHFSFRTPLTVPGGPSTLVRVRVTTPAGSELVMCTIRAQYQSTD